MAQTVRTCQQLAATQRCPLDRPGSTLSCETHQQTPPEKGPLRQSVVIQRKISHGCPSTSGRHLPQRLLNGDHHFCASKAVMSGSFLEQAWIAHHPRRTNANSLLPNYLEPLSSQASKFLVAQPGGIRTIGGHRLPVPLNRYLKSYLKAQVRHCAWLARQHPHSKPHLPAPAAR